MSSVAHAETRIILSRFVYNFDMELVSPEKALTDGARVRFVWTHQPLMVTIKPVLYAKSAYRGKVIQSDGSLHRRHVTASGIESET